MQQLQGAFGEVFSADWRGAKNRVAVKMLKNVGVNEELDAEAAVLARLDHQNVIRLFGVSQERSQILLVFELMALGDLKGYLRHRAPNPNAFYSQFPPVLSLLELLHISCQVFRCSILNNRSL